MSEKYRAGIIASGGIAQAHAGGYKGVEQIELIACADIDENRAKQFSEMFGIPKYYTDYRKMLDEEKLDIVSVCSWHPFHAEMTIAAAARKPKVILCEKPMTTSLGDAERMLVACRRNNVKLAIAHQRRFLPSWNKAKELVQEGAIGKARRLYSSSMDGILNCVSHALDCQRFVIGDLKPLWVFGAVQRKTDRYERNIRCEDCAMGLVQYENEIQGLFESDLESADKWKWRYIYGSDGMIDFDDGSIKLFNATSGGWKEIPVEKSNPHVSQAKEIVDWVEGRAVHRGQAENSWWTMQIMMGVYESVRCHEAVKMPLQTRVNPLGLMIDSGHLPVERPGAYDIRSFLLRGESMNLEP